MANYTFTRREPFIINGECGSYEIPHPKMLSGEAADIALTFDGAGTTVERAKISAAFFATACPDISAEDFPDVTWVNIMMEYSAWGADKGLGES